MRRMGHKGYKGYKGYKGHKGHAALVVAWPMPQQQAIMLRCNCPR
jgi:hypothetical protein